MSIVTRRNLLAERTRFLISVGGIALSVFLILFLLSLFQGWERTVGRFVERVDADVWIARDGTTDFLNAASILPAGMRDDVAALPDVDAVDALIVRPMNFGANGDEVSAHLVGYEVNAGAAGPPDVAEGKDVPGAGEVIIEEAFADKAGIGVGDTLEASGSSLRVVGISTGGDFVFSQTLFVDIETARELLDMGDLSTFYLLHLADRADGPSVIESIERNIPVVNALSGDEFAEKTRSRIMDNLIPILIVILFLAFIVGVAITGLTIYTATVERAREYGVLKAIGFTNGYLFRLVVEQSMVTGLLGFAVGAGLAALATRFVGEVVPQFVTLLRWQDLLLVLATTLVMSCIAAVIPLRRIATVDPVAVFAG